MDRFVTDQEVEVFYEGKAGVKLWLQAKIVAVHINYYRVHYHDKIPDYKDSLSTIPRDDNIAAKLRPRKQQHIASKLETSQFNNGDEVSYKCKGKWVSAKVIYVAGTAKFIRIGYIDNGYKTEQINECEYSKCIRIAASHEPGYPSLECKDNTNNDNASQGSQSAEAGQVKMETDTDGTNEADGNESDEVGLDSTPPDSGSTTVAATVHTANNTSNTQEDDANTRVPMAIDSEQATAGTAANYASKNVLNDKSGSNTSTDNTSWYNPLHVANKIVNKGASIMGFNSKPEPAPKPKKKRTWDQKAISDWGHKDVVSWINSLKSAHKYSPGNFPEYFDGKELLKTEEADLTLIIKSSMFRKLFMKHLAKAKVTYETAAELDEDEYENDDRKEAPRSRSGSKVGSVNGVVGLRNQGNTCYMNTSIQILSQTPYITQYLAKRAKLKTHRYYPMLSAWTQLCNVIYNQSCRAGYYTTFKPTAIRNALRDVDKDFGSGAQDDSARSLGYMLQELDKEIEQEINQTDIESRNRIELQPGPALSESDVGKYVARLRDEHNPPQISSVLKKAFDGIKHETTECLECNQVYQTFSVFRVIDLPVASNQIILKNIHVVCNDTYYSKPKFPEISALGHCSVDVLRYHATEYLSQFMDKSIDDYHCDIVCITTSGNIKDISNDRISDLQNMTGTIFVLINTKKSKKKQKNRMLQFCLGLNEDGETSHVLKTKANTACISYKKYDQDSIYKLVQREIAAYNKSIDDDQKYDYYINYNDNIFSMEELEKEGIAENMHNDGINKLLLLRVNPKVGRCGYDISNIDEQLLGEAECDYPSCSQLQALNKHRNQKIKYKKHHQKKGRYERIQQKVESEISAIEQTIAVFKARENIRNITSQFLTEKSRFVASTQGLLRSLTECIEEYEKPQILDESAYAHPCPCKGGSRNSEWVKYKKTIVYQPPIFLFHLDRYGKNMSDNYTSYRSSSKSSGSYSKGQSVMVKFRNDKFYKAKIVQKKSNKMKIKWADNGKEEWIEKWQYSTHIKSLSSSSTGGYGGNGGYWNSYGGNKYSHGINYNMNLAYDDRYYLYGVSNHSGSTSGGHYTATVNCLSDNKWYDISDSNVNPVYEHSATSHPQSATILAYVRPQDQD